MSLRLNLFETGRGTGVREGKVGSGREVDSKSGEEEALSFKLCSAKLIVLGD